jgi:hypothetical protein
MSSVRAICLTRHLGIAGLSSPMLTAYTTCPFVSLQDEAEMALVRLKPGPDSYGCVLSVNDSDHKPVYACLQVSLPSHVQENKRRHSMQV